MSWIRPRAFPLDDVVEVSNYVAALDHGLGRLRGGFPVSTRLIREMHENLMSGGQGGERAPGEFRRSQNWVGGRRASEAVFVPPPASALADCLSDLEAFLNEDVGMPALVRAGLAHVQFETIHPFLDGNGRVGRLLITLLLCRDEILQEPLLYLSLYFKQRRAEYYDLLDRVRRDGDWEAWVTFFLQGVAETAEQAVSTAQNVESLFQNDQTSVQALGRNANSALRVHQVLKERPIVSLKEVTRRSGLSFPAASKAMEALEQMDLVRELTGKRRNRLYGYDAYLEILNEGTELP